MSVVFFPSVNHLAFSFGCLHLNPSPFVVWFYGLIIIADGAAATIKIVEKDADGTDDPLTTLSAVVSGGRIKCWWQVKYTADEDDADSQKELAEKGYTLPEYAFVVECGGATSGESGVLEVYADFIAKLSMNGKLLRNYPYILKLADGSCRKGQTNSEGYITENELPVGKVKIL